METFSCYHNIYYKVNFISVQLHSNGDWRTSKLTRINLDHVCERDAKSTHTHDSFGVVKFCSLRGEGRRGREGELKNGVRMKSYDYIRLDWI